MFGIYLLINIQVLFLFVLWYMLFYIFESEIVNCWVMSNSLWHSMDCGLPKVLCLWDFPGKNTGVGSHFLLQGIFLTQRSNLLSYIAGNSLPSKPPGKPFYWDIIHILIILLTYNLYTCHTFKWQFSVYWCIRGIVQTCPESILEDV